MDESKKDINKIDFNFSIALMGESECGKTSFKEDPINTIGFDYHYKFISWENKIIKLTLWDTSGIKTFSSLSAES